MKANEFVREYGWDEAKKLIDSVKLQVLVNGIDCVPCFVLGDGKYLGYDELKRLVESWELVEKHGGLEKVKQDILIPCLFGDNDFFQEVTLKKAVKDVESCQ